jgi:hypothetical protein
MENVCFIIAYKYYREYKTYIKYYVDNIQKFYPNALTLIVDNNSRYLNEDIIPQFENYNNLVILINDSECKFELGAYKVGLQYILDKNLSEKYSYYICTQDTFVLKNKYDFNYLTDNNIFACSIIKQDVDHDRSNQELFESILKEINMYDCLDKIAFCCCNSFILHNSKIAQFVNITKNIVITDKRGSGCSERFLSRILYELNNNEIYSLYHIHELYNPGTIIRYDFFSPSVIYQDLDEDIYFVKYTSVLLRGGINSKKDLNLLEL